MKMFTIVVIAVVRRMLMHYSSLPDIDNCANAGVVVNGQNDRDGQEGIMVVWKQQGSSM